MTETADRPGWLPTVVLGGIVVVAVGFRFHALGRLPGINGDEAWAGVLAQRIGHPNPDGWLTSSGNLPAPFHLTLLALFARVAPPSFALLRVPTVLASLAQVLLTFVVARRHWGRSVAIVAVLLSATFPMEIAYARFGWDPSYAGLVAVAALHFAMERRFKTVAALYVLGMWIHPTNIFLAPFLLAAWICEDPRWRSLARRVVVGGLVAFVGLLIVLVIKAAVFKAALFSGGAASAIVGRVIDPRQWWRFALSVVRLLDGDTIFTYITGAGFGAARLPIDLAAAGLMALALVRGGPRLVGQPRKLGIVVGCAATFAAFFVFAGPEALAPGVERYGLCLFVPAIFALAILIVEAGQGLGPLVAAAGVAVACLLAFGRFYFAALEATGSTAHPTFWTGPVEPKAEAFRKIVADAAGKPAHVAAESWWLSWPLAYLAHGTAIDVADAAPLEAAPPRPGTYLVGFPGGRVEAWAQRSRATPLAWEIHGVGDRVVLRVWKTIDQGAP